MSMIDSVAEQLRQDTAAVRLSQSRFGARKAITKEQRGSAASIFSAEANMLSASKKLLDTKAETYKNVTAILSRAKETWKFFTVPYPEDGIRLIKRERVESFQNQMIGLQAELDQAVAALQDDYHALRNKARTALGDLFDPTDYPDSLNDEFALAWEFPSVEPPLYLKELNPKLYEQEEERIRGRFEEAVVLTEQAFIEEFARLLGNLADKLTGLDDNGCQKAFKDSSVEKLGEFFQRFQGAQRPVEPRTRRLGGTSPELRVGPVARRPAQQLRHPVCGGRGAQAGERQSGKHAGQAAQAGH